MVNLVWRLRAKIVACIDIVLLSLGLLGILGLMLLSAAITNDPETMEEFRKGMSDEEAAAMKSIFSTGNWMLWAFVVVGAVMVGFQLWAAIKLLRSAKLGLEPDTALGKARIWMYVTIGFFVLSLIGCGLSMSFVTLTINIIYRGTALYIVYNFMKELESNINSQSGGGNNFPVGVIVK